MPALFVYLLQANAALLLFVLAYYALLRPLTFYRLNRFFLLAALLLAAVCPLIDVAGLGFAAQYLPPLPAAAVATWYSVVPATPAAAATTSAYWQWLTIGYWAGAAGLLARIGAQLVALRRLHRRSRPVVVAGLAVRQTTEPGSAFSFWQTIYLNPAHYPPADLPTVVRHEQVHVQQWHTLDTLLGQLAVVGAWLNPGAWLLRRAIQENLEFLTDQHLLQTGLNSREYQYSLLRASALASGHSLGNHFHFLTLKTRILMMNKQQSSRRHLAKYALLAPLALGLSLAFAGPKTALSSPPATLAQAGLPTEAVYYIDGKLATKAAVEELDPNSIAGMNALKGENVGKVLGNTKATEAILITTKNHENATEVVALNRKLNALVEPAGKLLLVGDKEVSLAEFRPLLAAETRQVTALSAQDARQRFGERGRNGAVLIAAKP